MKLGQGNPCFQPEKLVSLKKKSVLANTRKRTGMSNKYEREIEEILRNLERTEPKVGFGRRTPRFKTRGRPSMPRLSFAEWCLLLSTITAMIAGGWAYAYATGSFATLHPYGGSTPAMGVIAIISLICIALTAISSFVTRPSSSRGYYNNVTPIRGNIFRRIGTTWHLWMLKLRYRKRHTEER